MKRRIASIAILATAALGAALMTAGPAQAKPVITPGWSPMTPPTDPALFEQNFPAILYAVSCGGLTATGWSAEVADDTVYGTGLVTTSAVVSACLGSPESIVVRQGDEILPGRTWVAAPDRGLGLAVAVPDRPYIDWDYVPMPRVGQWVALDGRAADGSALPMLERRVVSVGDETFALDLPVPPEYAGAPVVDNMARALGTMTAAGVEVTGTPQFCDVIFICDDPGKVWLDVTAPSAPQSVKATPGKGSVAVTWKPALSDGGAEVAYWYRVGSGRWTYTEAFRVTVKARTGRTVTVTVGTANDAGPGPTVTVSAKAR